MAIKKIQIEDYNGDIYYPHTSSDVVKRGTSTVDKDLKTIESRFNAQGAALGAEKLATARKINGVAFNGTKDIDIKDNTKLPTTGGDINGDLNVTGNFSVGGPLKGATEVWGKDSSIDFLPKKGTGYDGGLRLNWTGGTNVGSPRYQLIPIHANDIRLGSPSEPFLVSYVTNPDVLTSDREAKENIKYIDDVRTANLDPADGLSKLDFYNFFKNEINFATYDFKNGNVENLKTNIGFIAQDIAKTKVGSNIVIPPIKKEKVYNSDGTFVEKDVEKPMYSYSSGNFYSALGIALQCAIEKIELLESEIKVLKGGN